MGKNIGGVSSKKRRNFILQAPSGLSDAHPASWGWIALLSLLNPMPTSLRNALPDAPAIMFYQLTGHPLTQSSWHTNATNAIVNPYLTLSAVYNWFILGQGLTFSQNNYRSEKERSERQHQAVQEQNNGITSRVSFILILQICLLLFTSVV